MNIINVISSESFARRLRISDKHCLILCTHFQTEYMIQSNKYIKEIILSSKWGKKKSVQLLDWRTQHILLCNSQSSFFQHWVLIYNSCTYNWCNKQFLSMFKNCTCLFSRCEEHLDPLSFSSRLVNRGNQRSISLLRELCCWAFPRYSERASPQRSALPPDRSHDRCLTG